MILPQVVVALPVFLEYPQYCTFSYFKKKKKKAMFLRVSNLVKVSRHSTGEPGDVALMACEMQEDRQSVESLLDLLFPSASSVD